MPKNPSNSTTTRQKSAAAANVAGKASGAAADNTLKAAARKREDNTPTATSGAAIVKQIPASENGPGVECKTTANEVYHVTQNLSKQQFTLWRRVTGGYQKIACAKSPLKLYDLIPWKEKA